MKKINWEKTKRNINDRLCELAYKKQLAVYMGLGEQSVQRMLNEKNDRIISYEELVNIASFLRCEVDDLVIFENDNYIGIQFITKRIEPELKKIEEVERYADFALKRQNKREILNLYEFILYLPLMNFWGLGTFMLKGIDNLDTNREYLMEQLNKQHDVIKNGPEKEYADWYRDNILRVKGDPYEKEWNIKDEFDWDAKEKYEAKVEEFVEFCKCFHALK